MDRAARSNRRVTGVATAVTLVTVVALASLWVRGRSLDVQYGLFIFHNAPTALLLSWLGRMVVLRRPGNRIGPILMVIAGLGAAHCAVAALADVAIVRWGYTAAITNDHPLIPAELPLSASVPFWIMNWLWLPQVVLLLTVLPAIFPDGSLPGPRWRIALWLAGVGGSLFFVGLVVDAWPTGGWGTGETPATIGALLGVGLLVTGIGTLISVAALVVAWHRAEPGQRIPFRVVGTAFGVLAVLWIAAYPWPDLWVPTVLVGLQVLLVAYALAAARFRVHDLEPVLARSTVANALSMLATAGFVAVVLSVGIVAARLSHRPALPWIAVGVITVAAEPVRRWTRRGIERLVYRLAADRTAVVSEIAAHAGEDAADELLPRVVDALRRSTGAARVEAHLTGRDTTAPVVSAGPAGSYRTCLAEPIVSHGERLGELRLHTDVAGDLAPGAAEVLADVARVTGTALHNSRLSQALSEQLGDLQASRRRLVEAHDTARRGIERDLHDGAQAQLIALRLRLAVVQAAAEAESPLLRGELAGIADQIDATVDTLRTLARGLQPPVLDQDGVAAALRSTVRGLPAPVTVTTDGFGRYDAAIETALYFACLEAVQNAVRHSSAESVTITLSDHGQGAVAFAVIDDGVGFDIAAPNDGTGLTNVADRLGALGGSLTVESSPEGGTAVRGEVPIG